jgi:hypothetical protein
MNCSLCQDSGVLTLYQNGMPIRRPCPCLTRHRTSDRIQLTWSSQPQHTQVHITSAEVRYGGHSDAISLLVVAAILPRFDHQGTFHIAAPTSGLIVF